MFSATAASARGASYHGHLVPHLPPIGMIGKSLLRLTYDKVFQTTQRLSDFVILSDMLTKWTVRIGRTGRLSTQSRKGAKWFDQLWHSGRGPTWRKREIDGDIDRETVLA